MNNNSPLKVAEVLEQTFDEILSERMSGIPLLNTNLRVQAIGFQEHQDRIIGVIITPWLMNFVMLPGDEDNWDGLEIGKKQRHRFPSGTYKFMVNEIAGIGICQTYSLYSPMSEFINQAHAEAAARDFLISVMIEKEPGEDELVDEELLGRILRGETVTGDGLEKPGVATANDLTASKKSKPADQESSELNLSRRDLLTGRLSTNTE